MPNLQFSTPETEYVEGAMRAKRLGISLNRLAKGLYLAWLGGQLEVNDRVILEALNEGSDVVARTPRLF